MKGWKGPAHAILRLNIRALLLRPFQFPEENIEVMLRVIVVLLRREGRRLGNVRRCAGDGGTVDIRWLGVFRVWLDAFCGGGG